MKIHVVPVEGRLLRHPAAGGFKRVKPEGELVDACAFWRRRLRAGDCVLKGDSVKQPAELVIVKKSKVKDEPTKE